MKKIIFLSLILTIISSVTSAQRITGTGINRQRPNSARVTRPERFQLRRDIIRLNIVQRNARRDGVLTPLEKRRVNKTKIKTRRDAFRFRHNGRS
jgi:hypothetical protein